MIGSELPLPDAVLWDMDGTIVDTEPFWMDEETVLAAEYGRVWTYEDGLQLVGLALDASGQILVDRLDLPLTVDQVVDRLITGVARRVELSAPWRPGARELLAALHLAAVPMALVTMSYTSLADAVVATLPPGTFATVVTGDRVTHGKPHPEPYLLAAAELGVDPARCVAIEDSPPGLASAEAAGCRSIGVEAHVPIPAAPGRSRLASLADADLDLLARLVAGETVDDLAAAPPPRH
jgi:HAD superfamily hydrolase (TIGR01509 family)